MDRLLALPRSLGLPALTRFLCASAVLASLAATMLGGALQPPAAVLLVVALVSAAILAARSARSARGTRRLLFGGIATAAVCIALAEAGWWLGETTGARQPFPGVTDLLLLAAQASILVAVTSALGRHRHVIRFETAVDGLLLIAAAAILIVHLDYRPAALTTLSPPAFAVTMLWQLITAASLVVTAILLAWRGELLGGRSATGLSLGTVLLAFGSAWYVRGALIAGSAHSTPADTLFVLAMLCYVSLVESRFRAGDAALSAELPRVASDAAMVRAIAIVVAILIAAGSAAAMGWRETSTPALGNVVAIFGLLLALRTGYALWTGRRTTQALEHTVEAEREISVTLEHCVDSRTRELAEAQRVLQRMWTLAQQIAIDLNPDRVLQRFIEAVVDVVRGDGGAVGLLADDTNVQIAAGSGIAASLAGSKVRITGSAMGDVIRGGPLWTVEDAAACAERARMDDVAALLEHGARGVAVLPLERRGERIGAVTILSRGVRRFRPEQLAHVEAMTDLVSVALSNADLVDGLRRAEWRFRTLFRAAPDAVLTVLESGRIREANDAIRDITGLQPIQVVGHTLDEFVAPNDRTRLRYEIAQAIAGEPSRIEVTFNHQDGPRVVALAARALPEADPPAVLFVGRDMTKERAMRERLAETERLAAVGELVAGVAHEVNNPLSTISAFAQLLLREKALGPEQLESVEIIRSETVRASQVLKDLLTFARRSEREQQALDLNDVVERSIRLRTYEMSSKGITWELELGASLPAVTGDARQLQQVVINLVTNAIQAMSTDTRGAAPAGAEGGRLRVGTHSEGGQVILEVSDTGPGVAANARARIFEPFFTTKKEGTGLGLSVSYGIITAHGGTIALIPSTRGATFRVSLPAATEEAIHQAEQGPSAFRDRSLLRGRRVLFVDDEPSLCSGITSFGRLRRFDVVTAEDGAAALAATRVGEFDFVVCDLRMPGMDGRAFYEALQPERPELASRTIFITGDVVSPASQSFLSKTGQPVLAKPFEFERLEEAMITLLNGRRAEATACVASD